MGDELMMTAPVCVGIPTFARGARVLQTLARVYACEPRPAEVVVHVDASDGTLEEDIQRAFPSVRLISSETRVGPGGGRHRCLAVCTQPYFVSFDDDSLPIDDDFFLVVARLFRAYERLAVLAATIHHPGQPQPPRNVAIRSASTFTGCGYAMRVEAYRSIPGNIDRAWAYGIEEVDVSLQLDAAGWEIGQTASLRVFHDSVLAHHANPEIVAAAIQNVALLAYLRYPPTLWPRAALQVANRALFSLRRGQYRGVLSGLCRIPATLSAYAAQRAPLPAQKVRRFLKRKHLPAHDISAAA